MGAGEIILIINLQVYDVVCVRSYILFAVMQTMLVNLLVRLETTCGKFNHT